MTDIKSIALADLKSGEYYSAYIPGGVIPESFIIDNKGTCLKFSVYKDIPEYRSIGMSVDSWLKAVPAVITRDIDQVVAYYSTKQQQSAESNKQSPKPAESNNVAVKFDSGKPRPSLLSPIALLEVAKVATMGAQKYSDHNWRKGMKWSRLLDAANRHVL